MHMEIAINSVLIAICRQSGDTWQSKNRATNGNQKPCFQQFLSTFIRCETFKNILKIYNSSLWLLIERQMSRDMCFQQCDILTWIDSDEPVSISKKLQIMFVQKLNIHIIFKRQAKALIRLCVCAGWSEHLLVEHITLLEISYHAAQIILFKKMPLWGLCCCYRNMRTWARNYNASLKLRKTYWVKYRFFRMQKVTF